MIFEIELNGRTYYNTDITDKVIKPSITEGLIKQVNNIQVTEPDWNLVHMHSGRWTPRIYHLAKTLRPFTVLGPR